MTTSGSGSDDPADDPWATPTGDQEAAARRSSNVTRQDLPLPPKPDATRPVPIQAPPMRPQETPAAEPAESADVTRQEPPGEPDRPAPPSGDPAPSADATQRLTPPPEAPAPPADSTQRMAFPAADPPPAAPGPPGQQAPAYPAPVAPRGENWHRLHYPIGVFLVVYGVTALVASLIGWSAHEKDLAGYLGDTVGAAGAAAPALIAVKVVEGLLLLVTAAGLIRHRDVWFLPALVGWTAGFAAFAVLDLWAGRMGRLLEHGAYLLVFALLLALSYALSVKVRVGRNPRDAEPGSQAAPGPGSLSRTQEIALAALNRWQRQTGGPADPQPQPPQGPPPGP